MMRTSFVASSLALCASSVLAFSDTSPFIFLSTARIPGPPPSDRLQSSASIAGLARDLTADCPTSDYLLISQPHVNAADLTAPDGSCMVPNFCRAMAGDGLHTRVAVSEVVGTLAIQSMGDQIRAACEKAGKAARVQELILPALPTTTSRSDALADNDYALMDSLEQVKNGGSYTILYFAGAGEPTYEADFGEPIRMDLRRHLTEAPGARRRAESLNGTGQSLFDTYQFFTPGILVGLIAVLFILSILSAGLKALGSLEVPYGAFEKEMGPAAQKKQH